VGPNVRALIFTALSWVAFGALGLAAALVSSGTGLLSRAVGGDSTRTVFGFGAVAFFTMAAFYILLLVTPGPVLMVSDAGIFNRMHFGRRVVVWEQVRDIRPWGFGRGRGVGLVKVTGGIHLIRARYLEEPYDTVDSLIQLLERHRRASE
jgi:hypothetical protein